MEGRDQDLLDALRSLVEEKRQARVTHAYRVVMRFGLPIRTRAEVGRFLAWMKAEGFAASTQFSILGTIRSVQPGNELLRLVLLSENVVFELSQSKVEFHKLVAKYGSMLFVLITPWLL